MNPKSKLSGGGCRLQKQAGGLHGTLVSTLLTLLRQVKKKKVTAGAVRK